MEMILSDDGVYDVVAVHYGRLLTTRMDAFLNFADYNEPDGEIELAYYFWVIRNSRRTVVLDTGFASDVGVRRGREVLIDPVDALRALEVDDEAETVVVVSHAHYDHIGNVDFFRRARVVMSAEEFDFWIEHPRDQHLTRQLVEDRELDVLGELRRSGRLELIRGEMELAPGITVISAPGHTPGELALAVETRDGTILLAADAVHFDEELSRRMPFRHMCDIVAGADSYEALSALRDSGAVSRIFAGHEPPPAGAASGDPRLPDHTYLLSPSADHHERDCLVFP